MPYGRRIFKRRRLGRGRYGLVSRARSSTRGIRKTSFIARKALRIAKSANYKELKHLTAQVRNEFPGRQITDVFHSPMQTLGQGFSDQGNRIGDSVMVKSLHLKGTIQLYNIRDYPWNSTAGNLYNYWQVVRLWVAVFPNPSTPPNLDLLQLFDYNDQDFTSVLGPKIWDNRFRSRLLYNKLYVVHANKPITLFDIKLKINLPVQWDQSTGFITKNRIVYGFQSDLTTSGTQSRIDHVFQFTYTDS